jgi:hypothetical protein
MGIGSLLLEGMLRRTDAEAIPMALKTTNPRNVAIHERHDYRMIDASTDSVSGIASGVYVRSIPEV